MLASKVLHNNHRTLTKSLISLFVASQKSSLDPPAMKSINFNNYFISCINFQKFSQSKLASSLDFNSLTHKSFSTFSKSHNYVDNYNSLIASKKQKEQKIKDLQEKVQMLNKMSQTSALDKIMQLLFNIFGQQYETAAVKQHKSYLIDLRNELEKKIQESSIKWQGPRKLILEQREKKVSQFIEAIIEYERKMAEFIKKRQDTKAEHLADVNEGLVLTYKLLVKNIEKEGGIQIKPEINLPFDDSEHEAINFQGQIKKNSKVKQLVIHGWKLKEKVVKKALVAIN